LKIKKIIFISGVMLFIIKSALGYTIIPPELSWAELFSPQATVTFSVVEREASYYLTEFGWYNAGDHSSLYTVFGPNLPNNIPPYISDVTVNFDSSNSNYLGGAIGFFLKVPTEDPPSNGPIFYYYTQGNLDNPTTTFDHSLVYGTGSSHTYVIKWEDYECQAQSDKDFNDLVVKIDGIDPVPESPSLFYLIFGILALVIYRFKRNRSILNIDWIYFYKSMPCKLLERIKNVP
jgi:hypothetical protein